ncbi:MAG TPA: thioesterase family protein [Bacillales bacterium]|nr:thioesterase family protein [Bacillales bacterium]
MAVTELTARYSETDQMGVIHHSTYVNWFEVGRTNCIRDFGVAYHEIEAAGFLLPVVEVNVSYKVPAKYEDVVQIVSKVSEYNGLRLNFHYEVKRKRDGILLVEGETKHCWTRKDMKPISLKKHWPQLHATIEKMAKEEN